MLNDQITNPAVGRFVADRCTVAADSLVPVADLFAAWQEWCSATGAHPGSVNAFAHQLRRAAPAVAVYRPRNAPAGDRVRHYRGITLR